MSRCGERHRKPGKSTAWNRRTLSTLRIFQVFDVSRWYRTWHAVSRRPVLLAGFLILVSAVLLPVMEVEALYEAGPGYAERLVPAVAQWLANTAWVPSFTAATLSITRIAWATLP